MSRYMQLQAGQASIETVLTCAILAGTVLFACWNLNVTEKFRFAFHDVPMRIEKCLPDIRLALTPQHFEVKSRARGWSCQSKAKEQGDVP